MAEAAVSPWREAARPARPRRRVVVTGLGLVTPLGLDATETWAGVLAGRSGIARIEAFDTSGYPCRIGGEVKGFDPTKVLDKRDARRTDPFVQYGVAAALEALESSGARVSAMDPGRVAVTMSSGIGGLGVIEEQRDVLRDLGPKAVSPLFVPRAIGNMVAGYVSMLVGAQGPAVGLVSACASGAHSLGEAARMIERGEVDLAIAGGAEAAITPLGLAGFSAARALTARNDDPARASRPWDRDRDGFVLADGAGALVLEDLETARARGARVLAELLGYGATADAYHVTVPPPGGEGARRCMALALRDAGVEPDAVGYVNAHATSTVAGDLAEARALRDLFGPALARVPVGSTKSMTGHLLGAAGAVEAAFAVLALRDQVLPPTINLDEVGDGCELGPVPREATEARIDVALSTSFGFGGTNAALVFGRPWEAP